MSQEKTEKPDYAQIRAEHRRLSEMIEAGNAYHTPVVVRGIDGKEYSVEVYALSEMQFLEVFDLCKIDPREIGNQEKLLVNMKFLAVCAGVATRDPDLSTVLLPNQSAQIVMKTFELSGLTGLPKQS